MNNEQQYLNLKYLLEQTEELKSFPKNWSQCANVTKSIQTTSCKLSMSQEGIKKIVEESKVAQEGIIESNTTDKNAPVKNGSVEKCGCYNIDGDDVEENLSVNYTQLVSD